LWAEPNLAENRAQVFNSLLLVAVEQHYEGIPLARSVPFLFVVVSIGIGCDSSEMGARRARAKESKGKGVYAIEEGRDELRGIGDEVREGLENAVHSQDSIPAHVCVTILEVGAHRRHQGFKDLRFLELAEKA